MYSFTPDKRRISHNQRTALPPLPVSDSEDYNGTSRPGRGQDDSLNGTKHASEITRWTALEITGRVKNLSKELFSMTFLTKLYLNDNMLSHLSPLICNLEKLETLDVRNNQLQSLPAELGRLSMLRELHIDGNQLATLPIQLGFLYRLHTLTASNNPIPDEFLAMLEQPSNQPGTPSPGLLKLLGFLLDQLQQKSIERPPRQWLKTCSSEEIRGPLFTVMSYNVLCDKYATRAAYPYCPPFYLLWENRRQAILNDLTFYESDIYALQEVECREFAAFFQPKMKAFGFESSFAAKSRIKTMNPNDGALVDGCAIFFRTSKFRLLKEKVVEFNQLAMQVASSGESAKGGHGGATSNAHSDGESGGRNGDNMSSSADAKRPLIDRVSLRDNVALIAVLELKEDTGFKRASGYTPQQLIVVNVHIHWDPEYSDVKLCQTIFLLNELRQLVAELTGADKRSERSAGREKDGSDRHKDQLGSNSIPIIMCGDFNSLPHSAVLEYIRNGRVSLRHSEFREQNYDQTMVRLSTSSERDVICHDFHFESAYADGDLPFSNFSMHFRGVIDYIFYSPAHLRRAGMLPGVDLSWFAQNEVPACPHTHIPSDHIPLMAEFELLPSLSAGAGSMGGMSGGLGAGLGSGFLMGGGVGSGGVASAAPLNAQQHHSSLFTNPHQYASLHGSYEPYSTPPHPHSSQSHSAFGAGPGHPGQPSPPPPPPGNFYQFASPPNLATGTAPQFSGFSSYSNPSLGSGTSRIRSGAPTGQPMPLAPPLSMHSISQAPSGPGGPGQHFGAPHQQFYNSNEHVGGQRLYRR